MELTSTLECNLEAVVQHEASLEEQAGLNEGGQEMCL